MDKTGINRSIGCVTLLPAAVIGFAGLTDGVGPRGWRGFAELFGWFFTCLIVAGLLAVFLARAGKAEVRGYVFALAAAVGIGVAAYELLNWLGLCAPMSAKVLFTSSMQVFGVLGVALCLILIVSAVWKAGSR